jgi:PAS domain S-box-containing protein
MFRVKDSDVQDRLSPLTLLVLVLQLVALGVALGAFVWAALAMGRIPAPGETTGSVSAPAPGSTVYVFLVQMIISAIVVLAQVAGLLSFLRLRSRHRASLKSFHRVKLHAHNILASMHQGVVTTDHLGTVTSINSAAIRLLRIDFDCVGRPIASISTNEIPLADLQRRLAEQGAPVIDCELLVRRDGNTRYLLANAFDLKDTDGERLGNVIHLRDVTERLLMKEQMWRMEQFDRLSTMAAGLHHEIKNPLTALSIHVQLLAEQLSDSELNGKGGEFIGVLQAEVRRLSRVLESFRDFASLQRLAPRPTDVSALLKDVSRLMSPQAEQQHVALNLRAPEEPLPRVPLDPEKIEQSILNLVLNALEAMPDGGTLTLSASARDGKLHIEVEDTGSGIPEEVRESVFRPYFSTKSRGSGMGLALVEKLVRQHGGHVGFVSDSAGTAFRITLPLEERAEVNGNA